MSKRVILVLALLSLLACTPVSLENKSVDVEVYPTKYQLSVFGANKHAAKRDKDWNDFYSKHQSVLLNRKVKLSYSSILGKKVVLAWKNRLLNDGASESNLHINSVSDLGEFDAVVELTNHKVVTPICQPQAISKFASEPIGCAANSNIWQSMTYADDALLSE